MALNAKVTENLLKGFGVNEHGIWDICKRNMRCQKPHPKRMKET